MALYNIELLPNTDIFISDGNSKLGKGVFNLSLLPGEGLLTLANGTVLCDVPGSCAGCCTECSNDCYAVNFCKLHHNACIQNYAINTLMARKELDRFEFSLKAYLNSNFIGCMRWHVAGEIPSYDYLVMMDKLAQAFPFISFYFYTKRYEWLERKEQSGGLARNLVPTVSLGWGEDYDNPYQFHEFILNSEQTAQGFHCPATSKSGNKTGITCASCKRCIFASRGTKTFIYKH